MKAYRGASALIIAALVAACATTYREIDAATPHATIAFAKGYETGVRPGGATANLYWIADDAACANLRRAAAISYDTAAEQSRRVAAGAIAHFVADTEYYESAGLDITTGAATSTTTRCRSIAHFTPLAGHTYRMISEEQRYAVCALRVVDEATNAPPPDLHVADQVFCPTEAEYGQPQLVR